MSAENRLKIQEVKEEFTSHYVYIFQLVKQTEEWKISGITQKVLWNEGSSSIHKGAK
jgi:hypothetical protein